MKEIKFNDNDIFINDHLSPKNRELFALASELRRSRQYKYLWTKNGSIHMRKTDNSRIISIKNKNDLATLSAPEM